MKFKKIKKVISIFLISIFTLNFLTSCYDDETHWKARCPYCDKQVEVTIQWSGKYKYHNEYGYQVKIWDGWCKECGRYIGQFTGPI